MILRNDFETHNQQNLIKDEQRALENLHNYYLQSYSTSDYRVGCSG